MIQLQMQLFDPANTYSKLLPPKFLIYHFEYLLTSRDLTHLKFFTKLQRAPSNLFFRILCGTNKTLR